jgi:hypothetical protein
MQEMLGRNARPSDWNDACEICADKKGVKEETGNVYKCTLWKKEDRAEWPDHIL